ncbi:MAG: hypothetical protein Q3991_10055 [Rothia sp. (in: high G+C Gram-positive bacteria)]|uniref:hypothetical protein n=1 Tax=Rothia sp. (in: high G+C Gram-positive bacteria) TaxID=1885016 RepID=UPI0026DC797A|nr:hypothetical protein [Rothia sp. (in: high G+C Gram-positive bacteria)]MDO4885271.1 hypothetical protein [Rothia sp. (in: high G+C Gram-positive bacteria)]
MAPISQDATAAAETSAAGETKRPFEYLRAAVSAPESRAVPLATLTAGYSPEGWGASRRFLSHRAAVGTVPDPVIH